MLSAAPPLVASRRASPASPSANVVLRTTQREARLCATSRQRSRSPPGDAGEARRVAQRSGEGACNAPRRRPLPRRRRSRLALRARGVGRDQLLAGALDRFPGAPDDFAAAAGGAEPLTGAGGPP